MIIVEKNTVDVYVKSEGTQGGARLRGRGAHNACFMMIGEFPLEVIEGETSLNGLGLR